MVDVVVVVVIVVEIDVVVVAVISQVNTYIRIYMHKFASYLKCE